MQVPRTIVLATVAVSACRAIPCCAVSWSGAQDVGSRRHAQYFGQNARYASSTCCSTLTGVVVGTAVVAGVVGGVVGGRVTVVVTSPTVVVGGGSW